LKTQADLDKLASLIKTYFTLGGHHIQFNVVDAEILKKAQQDPEDFKSLIVRVAGYSAFFNELTRDVQDEIIQRTEQYLA
jgi:formate C-acetyltransferase